MAGGLMTGDELPIEARLTRHRCYYEGPLVDRPNVVLESPRNGYAGAARYGGWIWSGDTQSRWATLAAHVPVGVNDSLSLTPFFGAPHGGSWPRRNSRANSIRVVPVRGIQSSVSFHGRTWHLRLPFGWDTGRIRAGGIERRARSF